jgi:hypothetical protein
MRKLPYNLWSIHMLNFPLNQNRLYVTFRQYRAKTPIPGGKMSGHNWTRTNDLFCVREFQKMSVESIPSIKGHKSTQSPSTGVTLSIKSIISMLWYPTCTSVAPSMMKEDDLPLFYHFDRRAQSFTSIAAIPNMR